VSWEPWVLLGPDVPVVDHRGEPAV